MHTDLPACPWDRSGPGCHTAGSQQRWGCPLSPVPCHGWAAQQRHSPIPLLCSSPSQHQLYLVLASLHPLHDFLLAESCIYGSLKARALLVVEQIIVFLVSLSFIPAQDARHQQQGIRSALSPRAAPAVHCYDAIFILHRDVQRKKIQIF